jgi:coenzyme Q-binding protein COQ10
MPTHEERRRVPHAPEDVFALVADVRDYPSFISWIKSMRVLEDKVVDGQGVLVAEAIVGYKFIRERFRTEVTVDKANLKIDVAFLAGPFEALENRWRFAALDDGSTEIDFFITYEFSNPILGAILAANFDRAAGKIMDGFRARARERFELVGEG